MVVLTNFDATILILIKEYSDKGSPYAEYNIANNQVGCLDFMSKLRRVRKRR